MVVVMKKRAGDDGLVGRQSSGLQLLAEIVSAVGECNGVCGHSDPAACFSAVTQRKREAFLKTHHSLFLPRSTHSKPIIKLTIKGPRRPPVRVPTSAITTTVNVHAGFAAKEEDLFLQRLRARVCQSVGGEGGVGSKFSRVIRKKLTKTDLNPHHCRLQFPVNDAGEGFLTDAERSELQRTGGKVRVGVLIDSDMEVIGPRQVTLRRWKSGNTYMYNVCGGWKNVLKKQQLAKGDEVELWSFRTTVSGELCLALRLNVDPGRRAAAAVARKEQVVTMKMEHGNSSSSSLTQC